MNNICQPYDFHILSLICSKIFYKCLCFVFIVYCPINVRLLNLDLCFQRHHKKNVINKSKQQQIKFPVPFFTLYFRIKNKNQSALNLYMETVNLFTYIKKDTHNNTPFKSSRQISGVVCLTQSLTPWSGTGRSQGLCYRQHLQSEKENDVTGETKC